jgi:hypothetical protein
MPGTATGAFRAFFRGCLQRQAGPAAAALGGILAHIHRLPAARIEVVLDPPAVPEVPITIHCLDRRGEPIPGGSFALGPLLGPLVSSREAGTVRRFDRRGVETREVQLQMLVDWFAACWQSAGGRELPIPAFLGIRNDIEALDLRQMTWVPGNTQAIEKENSHERND